MTAHICSYLSSTAAVCTGQPLFTCGSRSATAKQVADRVAALSVGLAQRLGVQAGDCVCLAALATDHNLESLLAITAAGCIAAPINWRWAAAEGAHAARLVDAKLLVADAACLDFALQVAATCGCVRALLLLGDPGSYSNSTMGAATVPVVFAEILMAECPSTSLVLRAAPGNAALVVYTSGTTGKPKGVVLSHMALHVQSMAKLLKVGYSSRDVYLHAAPLFHIGGLSSALAMLMAGARHVFLPRFAPAEFLGAVSTHGVTSFIAVPAMAVALVEAAGAGGQGPARLESVETILLGGGGTSPALQHGLRALFPSAAVHTAYGMTEACSSMTFHTLWGSRARGAVGVDKSASLSLRGTGSGGSGVYVGVAPPGIELAVYHPPQGAAHEGSRAVAAVPAPPPSGGRGAGWGCVVHEGDGEVVTRGPHVMLGYWEDEAATQGAFLPGGWMRTGDLGCMRQGQLWLMGRAKDMIKSGGENVHAWEVERALAAHPAIAAAAVVGVSDWRLGEAVSAAVVLREGWEWRGPRCQVLLQNARAQAAAVAVAASVSAVASSKEDAALAVVSAAAAGKGGGGAAREAAVAAALDVLAGGDSGVAGAEQQHKLQAPASGWSVMGSPSDLRVEAARHGMGAGPMIALAVEEPRHGAQRGQRSLELVQLQRVAAGLLQLSALGSDEDSLPNREGGGSASEDSQPAAKWVDGCALQQHCRTAGLAGFKLPRVFLVLAGAEALPANSTGKVLKHLVRERVEREMRQVQAQAAPAAVPRSKL